MTTTPILLVDDNADDLDLTVRAFRKANVVNEIVVARDGQAALDQLLPPDGARGIEPAAVLLDLHMPGLGGLEVLRRLRSDPRTRLLPIVVLTTSKQERDRVESYSLGANSYVAKPVDFAAFTEAARLLGLYWALLNVPPPNGQ